MKSKILVALALVWLLAPGASAQAPRAHVGAVEGPPLIAITQLPPPGPSSGRFFTVYDSVDGSCANGGGFIIVYCQSTGTSWVVRNVQGVGGVGGAGSLLMFNGGAPLPAEPFINYSGSGVALTDNLGATRTDITIPAYTVRYSIGSTLVGTVTCPTQPPLGPTGIAVDCSANLTAFAGQTFAQGTLQLRGNFDIADPAKTSDGFKLEKFYIPEAGCSGLADRCGPVLNTLQAQLKTLANAFNPLHAEATPEVVFQGTTYHIKLAKKWVVKNVGWALNMSAGPHFRAIDPGTDTIVAMPSNITITVATNSNIATLASGNLCGGGTCGDANAIIRPGQKVRLSGTGSWLTGRQVIYVGMNSTGTSFQFTPPQVADYTGAAEFATGGIVSFDNHSDVFNNDGYEIGNPVTLIGGERAEVSCSNLCDPVNTSEGRTVAGGFRAVPIILISQYQALGMRQTMMPKVIQGRGDTTLLIAGPNVMGNGSSDGGYFSGGILATSGIMEQLHGESLTSNARLETGSVLLVLAPNFIWDSPAVLFGVGRFFYGAGNLSSIDVSRAMVEGAAQYAYIPEGGVRLNLGGFTQEQSVGGFDTCPGMDALADRPAFYDIGELKFGNANDIAAYSIRFGRAFWGCRKLTFLKINSPTRTVKLELDGGLQDVDKTLDITGNRVEIYGHLMCDNGAFGTPGACNGPPAQGKCHDFDVVDLNGDPIWTGRTLAELSGLLPLAKITDDATANLCQLSGGASGDPHWATCPGGTFALAGLTTDVLLSSPADGDVLQYAVSDGKWHNKAQIWAENLVSNVVYPFNQSTDALLVGGISGTLEAIRLNPNGSAIFNEQGAAVNFRVESDTNASMFCVDGTNNRVGIGTCTPATTFEVAGIATATSYVAGANGYAGTAGTPGTCSAGAYWFRVDSSTSKWRKCENGVLTDVGSGGGSGTVTSVDLSVPGIFTVTGTHPVTASGTLAFALNTQVANAVFAGPTSGGAAVPTFRALVAADIPAVTSAMIADGTIVNADISASAAIAGSKINPDFTGQTVIASAIQILCSGGGTCFNTSLDNGSTDFPAPDASGNVTFGSVNGVFMVRYFGEGASSKVIRVAEIDTAAKLGALFTGALAVVDGGTGLVAGTSGGIPYFSGTTAMGSSGVLVASNIVLGGGAAGAPSSLAAGTATQLLHGGSPPTWSQVVAADVTNDTLTAGQFAATLTFADGDLIDLAAINNNVSTEGLRLPQATSVTGGTAEGQIGWDTDDDRLYIGNGTTAVPQIPEFVLFNRKVAGTVTGPICVILSGETATGLGFATCSAGAGTAPTAVLVADRPMTITGLFASLQVAAVTTAGCDIELLVNGTAQGNDASNWLDYGGTALDAIGDGQFQAQNFDVTTGDRVEVSFVDAGTSQCVNGSGCACTSAAFSGNLRIWARAR